MRWRRLVPIALVLVTAIGCTSTKISTVETGLFENNPDKITAAYDELKKQVRSGKVITKEELECMGFDLRAPNIELVPGPDAFSRIFGGEFFLDKAGIGKLPSSFQELSRYQGYSIPYQELKTTADRIYISTQEIWRRGIQMKILVILKDDKSVCYHEMESLHVDTYMSRHAPLEGIITLIRGPGKVALSALETLREYETPGVTRITTIPIN